MINKAYQDVFTGIWYIEDRDQNYGMGTNPDEAKRGLKMRQNQLKNK